MKPCFLSKSPSPGVKSAARVIICQLYFGRCPVESEMGDHNNGGVREFSKPPGTRKSNPNTFVNFAFEEEVEDDHSHDNWVPELGPRRVGSNNSSSGVESLDNDKDDLSESLNKDECNNKRDFPVKPGALTPKASQQRRKNLLVECRESVLRVTSEGKLNVAQLQTLLGDRGFTRILFCLYDDRAAGELDQKRWFEKMKENAKQENVSLDLVDLIEAITYLVCQDKAVSPDDFHKIISTKGMASKMAQVLEKERNDPLEVDELMGLLMTITRGFHLDAESEERLRRVFSDALGKDKHEITLFEFKTIIPCKDEFFCQRIFEMFDSDGSGFITLAEFLETVQHFSSPDDDTKIEFLFNIFDVDGEGYLLEENFLEVIKACMKESKMEFIEEELSTLAHMLFDDGIQGGNTWMTYDDFKAQLKRQEGLVSNMGMMINKWLIPPEAVKIKTWKEKILEKRYFTKDYWRNNKSFLFSLFLIFAVNFGLIVHRTYYFRDFSMLNGLTPNPLYMISRACGRVIHANTWLLLFFVLRHTLTILQRFGVGSLLPLDHAIYLHKIMGWLLFFFAFVHTVCHLINFAINIQPNPVKFVQLTWKYWEELYGPSKILDFYQPPPGCLIVNNTDPRSEFCPPESFDIPDGVTPEAVINNGKFLSLCQSCGNETSGPWTYADWMLTTKPGLFGLCDIGLANPTGLGLILTFALMVTLSLPFVRRGGHFEIFFHSHRIGYILYFVLLILHAPDFYKWFLAFVGPVWIMEQIYRHFHARFGVGKTVIKAGVILPSKVTNLIIERPSGFNFNAGDWVWLRIPAVSNTEWHAFTISSAPEVQGQFTLHIRGVGQWTNRLYQLFEEEHARQTLGYDRHVSALDRIQGTVKNKYKSVKTNIHKSMYTKPGIISKDAFVENLNDRDKTLEERKRQRMEKKQEKLRRASREEVDFIENDEPVDTVSKRSLASVRYLSMRVPKIVKYDESYENPNGDQGEMSIVVHETKNMIKEVGKKANLEKPLVAYLDGPFGSPSSNIYRSEHAVLIGTNIGITPFASILQSIMHRYWAIKQACPSCNYKWTNNMETSMFKLKKVDFFWINRDQKSFEWFVNLLSQLEIEQAEHGGEMSRFLEMHMYVTSALARSDMRAVALQMALDIMHEKENRDLVTGLKNRTHAGRPNWNKIFTKLREERKGQVTVYYCGNPILAKVLRRKCEEFGFIFRKEIF